MSHNLVPTAVFHPHPDVSARAHVKSLDEYRALYERSLKDPDGFWTEQANRLDWVQKWNQVSAVNYQEPVSIQWYLGGKLNACYNCVDRHVAAGHGDVTAFIWEGNDPSETRRISYCDLYDQVQRAANALKALGVRKGDRVCIYLQMIP
jgi:acetyl-CoA synthetase